MTSVRPAGVVRHPGRPLDFSTPTTQFHNGVARFLAADECIDVRSPPLKPAATLIEVQRLVVDAGNARLVPTGMTEDRLDNVRCNRKSLMQRRRQRPTKVVQRPIK